MPGLLEDIIGPNKQTPQAPTVTSDDLRSMGSALLQKMDFFSLYGLPEYKPSADNSGSNYLGYIPIVIRNASFYGEELRKETSIDSRHDDSQRINIKLPWLPSEISDTVSVSYSRRGDTGIQLTELMATLTASLSESLANIALVEYNSRDLSKSLDLEFILPINRTLLTAGGTHYVRRETGAGNVDSFKLENIEVKDFMKNVRAYLGALQGLVYPRAYGFLYPPLLSVKLGGLYRGFKGFLREVTIRSSEEMLDLGNEMFPMIIRGNLRFINVFMYSWSDEHNTIAKSFVLSNNPQILFGMDYKDEDLITTVTAGENLPKDIPSTINNLGISSVNTKDPGMTAIQKAIERYNNFNYNDINYDSLYNAYKNMQNFDVNRNFGNISFDNNVIRDLDIRYADIINNMTNDQFNFLGINNNNNSLKLSTEIQSIIGSVQNVSNYANLLINIKQKDLFSSLSSLSRIVGSSGTALSNNVRTAIDLYWPIISILSTFDSGVSLDNVTNLYSNILKLLEILEDSKSITKNKLNDSVYVDNLYVEKNSNIISKINNNLNNINTSNVDMAPIIVLEQSNLILLETELLKNMDTMKKVNRLIYERAYDLKTRNILSNVEVSKYKQLEEASKNINVVYSSNINEALYNELNTFKEVLKS